MNLPAVFAAASFLAALLAPALAFAQADYFLNHAGDARIDAWVAIGLSGEFTRAEDFRVPVLDLYSWIRA